MTESDRKWQKVMESDGKWWKVMESNERQEMMGDDGASGCYAIGIA